MEIKAITDHGQISDIYHNRMKYDFPRDELKPLQSILHAVKNNCYECYGLFGDRDQELLGYAFFVRKKEDSGNHYLLDYYAVDRKHRNEGIGSFFIQQFPEMITDAESLIIEVEDPDKASDDADRKIRNRRLGFYLRNHCILTEIRTRLFGVDYRVLIWQDGRQHDEDEIRKAYTDIYKIMVPELLYRKFVKIS